MVVEIYPSPPTSSTNEANANKNQLENLGMIALEKIEVYLTTIQIFSNQQKIGQ